MLVFLPIISGILLALGTFYMKKLATSLPSRVDWHLVIAVLVSPFLYAFLFFNLAASITYIASMRALTLTHTFAVVFITAGATVLALDLFVNRVSLSAMNYIGFALGVVAVLLITNR